MNKKIVLIAGLVVVSASFGGYYLHRRAGAPPAARQTAGFHCPMHPDYKSDKPGECPICGMNLVPIEPAPEAASAMTSGKKMCLLHKCTMANCKMELPLAPGQTVTCPVCGTHTAPAEGTGKILYYRNPMNPAVTSPVAMKDSMGMDYVPVYEEAGPAGTVAGQGAPVVDARKRQLIGMKPKRSRGAGSS